MSEWHATEGVCGDDMLTRSRGDVSLMVVAVWHRGDLKWSWSATKHYPDGLVCRSGECDTAVGAMAEADRCREFIEKYNEVSNMIPCQEEQT